MSYLRIVEEALHSEKKEFTGLQATRFISEIEECYFSTKHISILMTECPWQSKLALNILTCHRDLASMHIKIFSMPIYCFVFFLDFI